MGSIFRRKLRSGGLCKFWSYKYYISGKPLQGSTGCVTKRDAERFLALLEGAKARGTPLPPKQDQILYDELEKDLLLHYKTTGTRNLREAGFRLAHLEYFRGRRVVTIGPSLVTAYVAHRQGEGASNRTVNIEVSVLKKMLNLAQRNGKLLQLPHFEALKEAAPRSGFFERDQHEAVWRHLPETIQPVATFAYHTGWRKQEILNLTWAQVDFEGGWIRLEPGTTKTGEGRMFPLIPQLRAVLTAQRDHTDQLQRDQGRIIPNVFHRNGKPIKRINRAWAAATRKAGVPGRIFHDYRRTAVRNMVRAGVPERVAMQLSGHKTRAVFDRYVIVSEGDLKHAGTKLAGVAVGVTGGRTHYPS